MNALIVEDDEIASDVVANALGQLGHRVDVVPMAARRWKSCEVIRLGW